MAHESFEDKEVAKVLNKDYISIKVDKEQYPHIDSYYQKIYQIMNKRGGGWPLSIIMTNDKKPFFSATYIPKNANNYSKGFIDILTFIKDIKISDLQKSGNEILSIIKYYDKAQIKKEEFKKNLDEIVISIHKQYYDNKYKGFSKSPKFPQANNISLLLQSYKLTKNKDALSMATDMLDAMARGGIYDQIEGGFYRYSVDAQWEIPHFEKMLYTNAELIIAYINAYEITKNPLYKKIVIQTIEQIDKRFLQDYVYMSASNADSENYEGHNEEGFYFVYTYDDVVKYLQKNKIDKKTIKENLQYLNITQNGNFEDEWSNPTITKNIQPKDFQTIKKYLVEMRKSKKYPFIDNKINTAWNTLFIKAKFKASIFDKKYKKEAQKSLDTLLKMMYKKEILYHQSIKGKSAIQKALLEDYSFLISCLFEAYQNTLEQKYFILFQDLTKKSINLFYKNNKWRESTDNFITYAKVDDNSYASALGIHLQNLILYSIIKADNKIYDIAINTLNNFSNTINTNSFNYPSTIISVFMSQNNPIFIKSNISNLKQIDTQDIKYPFVYKFIYDKNEYLACTKDSCFSYSKDFNKIKKDIESRFITKMK
jgi:uncharacterized protein YyaL (SSP411 family)